MKKILTSLCRFCLMMLPLLTACNTIEPQSGNRFELLSQPEVFSSYHEGSLQIKVNCPAGYDQVRATASQHTQWWMEFKGVTQGKNENEALLNFHFRENRTKSIRMSSIMIAAPDCGNPLEVKFFQQSERRIVCNKDSYMVTSKGGNMSIKVDATVEFYCDVTSSAGTDWLALDTDGMSELRFEVQPLDDNIEERTATIKLIEKKPVKGEDPLTYTVTLVQFEQPILIHWAAKTDDTRLHVEWNKGGFQQINPYVGTAEVLICPSAFNTTVPETNVIMGVSSGFTLKFGNRDQMNSDVAMNDKLFFNLWGNETQLPYEAKAGEWMHVAITWKYSEQTEKSKLCIFINGNQIHQVEYTGVPRFQFDPSSSQSGMSHRSDWWFAYDWLPELSFRGLQTEFRLWKIALKEDDLKEPLHFYKVDVEAHRDELLGCWSMVDPNDGFSIPNTVNNEYKDACLVGELMTYEHEYQHDFGCTDKITWQAVNLLSSNQ